MLKMLSTGIGPTLTLQLITVAPKRLKGFLLNMRGSRKYKNTSQLLAICAFLQNLMIMEQSPIIDYYPVDFKTDLNGKQQEWEAVVLIPFIDEVRITSMVTFFSSQPFLFSRSERLLISFFFLLCCCCCCCCYVFTEREIIVINPTRATKFAPSCCFF